MELLRSIFDLLFGSDPELRQIIAVTLRMSFFSTLLSSLIGIPLGVLLGANKFRGKAFVTRLVNTFLGLPPVVAGLIVLLLLSRSGPFGSLRLLYTVDAMVIAQLLLMVLKARTKTKKAFSTVAALIRIHLVSNLDIYWLIENCSRTYVRKRKRNKNSAIQLSLEL